MSEELKDVSEKLQKLNQLNESFYFMFGRLFRNRKLLDNEKTFKHIGAILFEQYKAEYEALKYRYEIIELPELEEVKERHFELVPRRWRPWWLLFLFRFRNRAAKVIDRKIYCEIEEHFRKKEEALERLEAALDKASENVNPFNEPTEPKEPGTPKELSTAENVAEQETKQTDKPAKTKPEKAKKIRKAKSEPKGSEQLRGQMTLDDVQNQPEQQKP